MRRIGGSGLRLGLSLVAATTAVLMATPAPAGDIPPPFTYYQEGGVIRSGPSGSVVAAYATRARPGRQYVLGSAPDNPYAEPYWCPRAGFEPINPNVRMATPGGYLPTTSGPINRPPGRYQICFYDVNPDGTDLGGTSPVFFDVVS